MKMAFIKTRNEGRCKIWIWYGQDEETIGKFGTVISISIVRWRDLSYFILEYIYMHLFPKLWSES